METDQMSGWLMIITFGGLLLFLILGFMWFLRRRSNREATRRAFDIEPHSGSDTAAPSASDSYATRRDASP